LRNRWYRFFWTELGSRLILGPGDLPPRLPDDMVRVLDSVSMTTFGGRLELGEKMQARAARYVYAYVWNRLRELGFSRPLRIEPWPGINLLIPFYRGRECVIPQSFSKRIPAVDRALAMVGKTHAARETGLDVWIAAAGWNDEILKIFRRGGVSALSLDRMEKIFGQVSK
jgi:hypothetical protein